MAAGHGGAGSAKGCDLMLFELVGRLVEDGLLREMVAGNIAYPADEGGGMGNHPTAV